MIRPTDPGARDLAVPDPDTGYAAFVRLHTPALLRMAYVLTGNALAAEELVQDTMVRLLPRWTKVEAAEVPIAYVRRSLANQYINQRRRAARREFAYADVPERADDHDPVAQVADRDEIWAGLTHLPERQRAALVLRYFEDLSDTDIAAALGARVGTVRSLISRGLATLRAEMAP
ncbi:SigE family RNA polymerase sigma factor [uncultured Jatrophihabitans sp.]|uniref:SigE family RNA polymerase sigma factor n=1 Tax=uncultured Jatrophihabitans sp. TaxID=1610747 RepID=UPI0035CB8420